jgi:assimilatory nitrate reductase catalytic subunit
MFANGGFFTPSGKGRILALTPAAPAQALSPAYPLRVNTGRTRDQWHTMTRAGKSPRLNQHMDEPWLEIHPTDAAACGVTPAAIARVESAHGAALLHWTGELASMARVCTLPRAEGDPVSGQPELKTAAVPVVPSPAPRGTGLPRPQRNFAQPAGIGPGRAPALAGALNWPI